MQDQFKFKTTQTYKRHQSEGSTVPSKNLYSSNSILKRGHQVSPPVNLLAKSIRISSRPPIPVTMKARCNDITSDEALDRINSAFKTPIMNGKFANANMFKLTFFQLIKMGVKIIGLHI